MIFLFLSLVILPGCKRKIATRIILNSSVNPSTSFDWVTLTASVVDQQGKPVSDGEVDFEEEGKILVNGRVDLLLDGTATYNTGALNVGPNNLTAVYLGTDKFTKSSSPTVVQIINKASTKIDVAALPPNPFSGDNVNITANVMGVPTADSGPLGAPSGTVTFFDGAEELGSVDLGISFSSAASANWNLTNLDAGNHQISAAYQGDGLYLGSTSLTLVLIVVGHQ
jgi:hypothetical protein